jgi:hypothetical protein
MCVPLARSNGGDIDHQQGATIMKQLRERPLTSSLQPLQPTTDASGDASDRSAPLALWRLNLLRVGYLFMGGGLAIVKWPLLLDHSSWTLREGLIECLLVGMSVLALMGLRYPIRLLPILLFEVTWKLLWLGVVALPHWANDDLDSATRTETGVVVLVVVVIAVIPWRHVLDQFVSAPGDPWRRCP